ncbi:MAG TPA: type II toxin-antitoxin system RelE/ParE family toxin [Rudaea sp.]
MTRSFRHKGLRRFFETGSTAGIQPAHRKRLQTILTSLESAGAVEDMKVPAFCLHALKGEQKGRWSVWVNGNWRVTFEFRDSHAYALDYEDYH